MEKSSEYSIPCPLAQRHENAERIRKAMANNLNNGRYLYQILFRRASKIINTSDREEIVCKFFLNMVTQRLETFKYFVDDRKKIIENPRFMAWASKDIRNLCVDYLRDKYRTNQAENFTDFEIRKYGRRKRNEPTDSPFKDSLVQNTFQQPEQRLANLEARQELGKALKKLDKKYRDVILRYYFKGLKYEEIRKTLNLPLGTVRSRLNKAKKNLKNLLLKDGEMIINMKN